MENDELVKFYERKFGPFVHMAPNDKAIWLRYLMAGGDVFGPFTYDVRVGSGITMPAGSDKRAVSAAYALTTKRIDVLCIHNNVTRIIEVKKRAGPDAIGQLITYELLFNRAIDRPTPTEKWLITDELQPDMVHVLIEHSIHYVEVGQ